MDLDRTEVSDNSESSLHCTICGAYHNCPVEPGLSFAILVVSCMLSVYVLLSTTVYVLLYMYISIYIYYLEWYCTYWSSDDTLTCSDIVLHVSSESCLVPTNIYSCHSSTVCRRHLHGIMESQCRVHVHSVQSV